MMQLRELVIKSIKEDNIDKILLGYDGYKCEISEFIAAEVPTDWPNIIRTLYLVYKEMPDLMVDKKFEEAILNISNQGSFELYCAVMVVFFQIMSEERTIAPFKINREVIINNLKNKLLDFQEELKSCKEWSGKRYRDGIWGDIRRVNTILYEDYGITIIETIGEQLVE